MNNFIKKNPAFVLGLFETGLGVIRSLGREGIPVIGIDYKKDIAYYSKYCKPLICPHPLNNEKEFLAFLIDKSQTLEEKPVLFITGDEFIPTIIENTPHLQKYFLLNCANKELINSIKNKFEQYRLAKNSNIPVPETFLIKDGMLPKDEAFHYPIFVKGADSNLWRKIFGGSKKGFVFNNREEFNTWYKTTSIDHIPIIIQELIPGPDINHYKFNAYIDKKGELRAFFCLRKIRQNPIHFGVGCVVESIFNEKLIEIGKNFLKAINYCGVGSAEFKYDERDSSFKLIELNPRFWQQNSLATACGINFPLIQYLDLTDQLSQYFFEYRKGIKWVNIYSDFDSFLNYRKEGKISFKEWLNSLKGPKIFSDWAWDDKLPGLYEFRFGKRLIHLPKYLIKRLIK